MAHFHDYNPWAATLVYVPSIAEATDQDYEKLVFDRFGEKIDAYILRQPSGDHSFGIRFGKEGSQYLSPRIDPEKAEMLLKKYGG